MDTSTAQLASLRESAGQGLYLTPSEGVGSGWSAAEELGSMRRGVNGYLLGGADEGKWVVFDSFRYSR